MAQQRFGTFDRPSRFAMGTQAPKRKRIPWGKVERERFDDTMPPAPFPTGASVDLRKALQGLPTTVPTPNTVDLRRRLKKQSGFYRPRGFGY